MFRKPKKSAKKAGLRRRRDDDDDDDDDGDEETRRELQEARKKAKPSSLSSTIKSEKEESTTKVLHHFESSKEGKGIGGGGISQKDLVTSTNQHHPTKVIDRKNKLLAGPIRATANIRTTCRFDYQPDICKDYKDTGFCGFGDSCIYLHDRGDTMSGWQLEQEWEKQQQLKKQKQQEQMQAFMDGNFSSTTATNNNDNNNGTSNTETTTTTDDGIPFACFVCRTPFQDPVVTSCGHYFCQKCIQRQIRENNGRCPICDKDTHGVLNEPIKLLSKKRKLVGRDASWKDYAEACQQQQQPNTGNTN